MTSTFGGMFPNENVVPGTVLYNEHYNIRPVVIEGYEPFSVAKMVREGIQSANDASNPINSLSVQVESVKRPQRPPPVAPKKKKLNPIKERNPVVPIPLPTSPVRKSPKNLLPSKDKITVASPVTVSRPGMKILTIPQVEFNGPVEATQTGLSFFKIEPVRLGTLPVSTPPLVWEAPIIKIPSYNMYNAPGRNAGSRPLIQEGIREIESFRPGDLANNVLRNLDREKLTKNRAQKGGKYYTNREVNDIALALGITSTNKKKGDLVDKILERHDEWRKNAD